MKKFFVLAVILGFVVSFGCAQKKVVAPEAQQPTAPQPSKETVKPSEKVTEEKVPPIQSKELPSSVEEVSGMFEDIHFDFDKYDIRDDVKPILKSVSDYLIKNAGQRLLIEGHCDERGTAEYNLGLGDRRAKAAKDYLISLGVPSSRLDTISYGKEKPLCDEHTEDCWAKNRRAHFVIMKGKK
ncbi:MAG: peptidoglycan-associated lipoprotein Pal [Thermodesulfovibrionales bacterium]|jgi:peptidoglycan-associated lipoprotein